MNPQRALKSHEIVPRVYHQSHTARDRRAPVVKPDGTQVSVSYDTVPEFGHWTRQRMSALRAMYMVEFESGQQEMADRILRAYNYLYTRHQNRKRSKR